MLVTGAGLFCPIVSRIVCGPVYRDLHGNIGKSTSRPIFAEIRPYIVLASPLAPCLQATTARVAPFLEAVISATTSCLATACE